MLDYQPSELGLEMDSSAPPCKHEFVRIYQRKLKGLERRLVATKAYLPVGFKQADFGHLSEGSYCFCTKCRARLYPKRTNAEKAQARLANQAKALAAGAAIGESDADELLEAVGTDIIETLLAQDETGDESSSEGSKSSAAISVEELDVDALGLEELGDSGSEIDEDAEEDDV